MANFNRVQEQQANNMNALVGHWPNICKTITNETSYDLKCSLNSKLDTLKSNLTQYRNIYYKCNYDHIFSIFFFTLVILNVKKLLFRSSRGVEWSLKNYGSRQILHESRNLGVTNKSLEISGSQKISKFANWVSEAKRKNRVKRQQQ